MRYKKLILAAILLCAGGLIQGCAVILYGKFKNRKQKEIHR